MAKSKDNIVMEGVSGKLGKVVFRQRAGKTILSRSPKKTDRLPNAAQLLTRDRFRQASTYGKSAIADPILKAAYKAVAKPGQSAYNVAFADFFKEPQINVIDTSGYSGLAGQIVMVKAFDNFKIVSVKVTIKLTDGTILESGNAVKQVDGLHWKYTTSLANANFNGSSVEVTVKDNPGHEAVMTKLLV